MDCLFLNNLRWVYFLLPIFSSMRVVGGNLYMLTVHLGGLGSHSPHQCLYLDFCEDACASHRPELRFHRTFFFARINPRNKVGRTKQEITFLVYEFRLRRSATPSSLPRHLTSSHTKSGTKQHSASAHGMPNMLFPSISRRTTNTLSVQSTLHWTTETEIATEVGMLISSIHSGWAT